MHCSLVGGEGWSSCCWGSDSADADWSSSQDLLVPLLAEVEVMLVVLLVLVVVVVTLPPDCGRPMIVSLA